MAISRCYDWTGDEGSNIEWMKDTDPSQADNPYMRQINILRLNELPADVHAFTLARYRTYPIVDDVLMQAMTDAGLKGFDFTPLQELTAKEWRRYRAFRNHRYWTKVRKERSA